MVWEKTDLEKKLKKRTQNGRESRNERVEKVYQITVNVPKESTFKKTDLEKGGEVEKERVIYVDQIAININDLLLWLALK